MLNAEKMRRYAQIIADVRRCPVRLVAFRERHEIEVLLPASMTTPPPPKDTTKRKKAAKAAPTS